MMDCSKEKNIASRFEDWTINSEFDNRSYQIFVSKPNQAPPPSGYPVIYVLDGNAFFQTFQEAVRLQSRKTEKTGVIPAIVVGIGYLTDNDFDLTNRLYDFTPSAPNNFYNKSLGVEDFQKTGGADTFLKFIEEDLMPQINKRFKVNLQQQTIFGHSLGGLFTLYTLFTHPKAFQNYIASSPSIWWNDRYILNKVPQFMKYFSEKKLEVSVFLAVGSLEKEFMINDTKELSNRLSILENNKLKILFNEVKGENHISVVPTILSRALRFVSKH